MAHNPLDVYSHRRYGHRSLGQFLTVPLIGGVAVEVYVGSVLLLKVEEIGPTQLLHA